MLWLGERVVSQNRFLRPQEVIARVKRIGPDDLQQLAQQILQNHSLNLALIGPLKEKDKKQIIKRLVL